MEAISALTLILALQYGPPPEPDELPLPTSDEVLRFPAPHVVARERADAYQRYLYCCYRHEQATKHEPESAPHWQRMSREAWDRWDIVDDCYRVQEWRRGNQFDCMQPEARLARLRRLLGHAAFYGGCLPCQIVLDQPVPEIIPLPD